MLIEEKALRHWIDNFYGFGSWEAPVWFISREESGGDTTEELAERLNYFSKVHAEDKPTLGDIRELYRHIAFRVEGPRAEKFATFYDHRFGPGATLHGAWKNLTAFVHGFHDKKLPDLLTYQKNVFASPVKAREALIRLYPLPAHHHAWYYSWLDMPQYPFLKSRALYEDYVYPGRIRHILENIESFKPEVVVMYGMENILALKKSVSEFFPATKFKMVKAIPQQIPQHHQADLNGTALVITTQLPSLRHNRIETGFDWLALGKMVKSETA